MTAETTARKRSERDTEEMSIFQDMTSLEVKQNGNIRPRWLSTPAPLVFLLWSLLLAFPYFTFGPLSYVKIHDNGDSDLPAKVALGHIFASGELGYWNSQWLSGLDRLAESYSTEFDLLLFSLLPGWAAYGFIMWLQRFVAGYFTFLLMTDCIKTARLPALYSGCAYALFAQGWNNAQWNGFTLYDNLALPGLPFILWALYRLNYRSSGIAYLGSSGLGFLLSINSVYAFAVFLIPAVVLGSVLLISGPRRKLVLMLSLFISTWVLSETTVLWASFLNAPISQRADWQLLSVSMLGPPSSPSLFAGGSFVVGMAIENVVALMLCVLALFVSRARDRLLVKLVTALVFLLCFVAGYPLLQLLAFKYLGFLGFQFDRVYLVFPFLAAVSGGIAGSVIDSHLHLVIGRLPFLKTIRVSTLLIVGALCWTAFQATMVQKQILIDMVDGSNYHTLYSQVDLQQIGTKVGSDPPFRVVSVPSRYQGSVFNSSRLWHPAFVWAYGLEAADGYVNLYSKRYQAFWEQVIIPQSNDQDVIYPYLHYWGNRVYLFPFLSAPEAERDLPFEKYYDWELLSMVNVRFVVSPVPLQAVELELVSSSIRDEQVAWKQKQRVDKLWGVIRNQYPGIPLWIYENKSALPRAFLASNARVFDTQSEVLSALRKASYNDLRSSAYLKNEDIGDVPLGLLAGKEGKITAFSQSSDSISIGVSAEAPTILIVTNNYSPFWAASVDGADTKIFPANHAFQGIFLDRGQRQITLEYRPPYVFGLLK